MDDLIKQAEKYLLKRYIKPMHTVAAALETTAGNVYVGINIDHFSGFVCAEMSALVMAMNAGETTFHRIAAVRKEPDGTTAVANACGKCRQILHDYAPRIQIAVSDDNGVMMKSAEELLPYSFKRQRQKIQDALLDEHTKGVVG